MELPVIIRLKLLDWLKEILKTEEDPRLCPARHKGIMVPSREFGPSSSWRMQFFSFFGPFTQTRLISPELKLGALRRVWVMNASTITP